MDTRCFSCGYWNGKHAPDCIDKTTVKEDLVNLLVGYPIGIVIVAIAFAALGGILALVVR